MIIFNNRLLNRYFLCVFFVLGPLLVFSSCVLRHHVVCPSSICNVWCPFGIFKLFNSLWKHFTNNGQYMYEWRLPDKKLKLLMLRDHLFSSRFLEGVAVAHIFLFSVFVVFFLCVSLCTHYFLCLRNFHSWFPLQIYLTDNRDALFISFPWTYMLMHISYYNKKRSTNYQYNTLHMWK